MAVSELASRRSHGLRRKRQEGHLYCYMCIERCGSQGRQQRRAEGTSERSKAPSSASTHPHDLIRAHALGGARYVLECKRQQRVACQDRNVLAVCLVVGGAAATEVVIIHRWEVVMDQRHRVHDLHGAGGGHGGGDVATHKLAGGQAQRGAHALAARKQGVAHRLVQDVGMLLRQRAVQRGVDNVGAVLHVHAEVEAAAACLGRGLAGGDARRLHLRVRQALRATQTGRTERISSRVQVLRGG